MHITTRGSNFLKMFYLVFTQKQPILVDWSCDLVNWILSQLSPVAQSTGLHEFASRMACLSNLVDRRHNPIDGTSVHALYFQSLVDSCQTSVDWTFYGIVTASFYSH